MASDVNVVLLTGRLTADPELRFTPKGTAIASLRLASNRYWKDADPTKGEFHEQNLFITADVFGKAAERNASQKKKGDKVMVRGRLILNEWVGTDGQKHSTFKLVGEDVTSLTAHNKETDSEDERSEAEALPMVS